MNKVNGHEKAPIAPTIEAHAAERKSTRKNVMSDNSTAVSNVISFRAAKLLLVEHEGQPFVPMKPVVEGMGLDWKTQFRKLQAGRFNSVVVIMTTTGSDGKQYDMSCLPLRKLAGWLMSIHASKVRADLRANVIAFQEECDDVLWAYWNDGHATNQRGAGQAMTIIGQTIGTDGFHMLASVVKGKTAGLPVAVQRRAGAKLWSQLHAAFGVRSAADIPAANIDSARNFIAAYAIEGEFLPKKEAPRHVLDDSQAMDVSHVLHSVAWVYHRWNQGIGDGVKGLNYDLYVRTWEHVENMARHARVLDSTLKPMMTDLNARFPLGAQRPGGLIA
jgi:hypothetical protein